MKENSQIIIAIIIGALIVGGAIIYSNKNSVNNENVKENQEVKEQNPDSALNLKGPKEVTKDDHIRGGNIDSKVKFIEFSDIECPFCKRHHQTVKDLISEYGDKVAFVYRHFPLEMHQNAFVEAHATECVAELGGNEKFWDYLDKVYSTTQSNDGLDLAQLPILAKGLGIDEAKFNECMESGRHQEKINAYIQDAIDSGARGTPYSVVVGPDNKKEIVSGALPKENIKMVIDEMLK